MKEKDKKTIVLLLLLVAVFGAGWLLRASVVQVDNYQCYYILYGIPNSTTEGGREVHYDITCLNGNATNLCVGCAHRGKGL